MRLLILTNVFPPVIHGGCEILCEQVCLALRQAGHEVRVLTTPLRAADVEREKRDWVVRELRLVLDFDRPPGEIRRQHQRRAYHHNHAVAEQQIQAFEPELVFVWSQLRLTLGAVRAAAAAGLPLAFTFNDESIAGHLPTRFGPGLRSLARYCTRDLILPGNNFRGLRLEPATIISRTLRDRLVAKGVPIQNAHIIHQGIALEQFPAKPRPGGLNTPARLGYAGLFSAQKGTDTIVDAAHRLAAKLGPEAFTLTLVGGGQEEFVRALRQKAEAGRARIEFRDRVAHAHMGEVYRGFDVFIFASNAVEGFGLAPLEAMASGATVVSTAGGGHGEIMEHGRNALVFAEGDAAQLAERLETLIRDPALSERLAVNARQMVGQRFDIARYFSEVENFLLAAVVGRGKN